MTREKTVPFTCGRYVVTDEGNVYSIIRGKRRLLKPYIANNAYLITFSVNCTVWRESIHRIVAKAFLPNPENLPYVIHKDKNPLNNHVNNLQWAQHTKITRMKRLTNSEIIEIFILRYKHEMKIKDIATYVGVSYSTVHKILNGHIYVKYYFMHEDGLFDEFYK